MKFQIFAYYKNFSFFNFFVENLKIKNKYNLYNFYLSFYHYEVINLIYDVLCFHIFAIKMIHLYNIMDNKKLPEKLLKQQEQDHLKQSY